MVAVARIFQDFVNRITVRRKCAEATGGELLTGYVNIKAHNDEFPRYFVKTDQSGKRRDFYRRSVTRGP
jgi:hypothetical protein